MFDSAKRFLTRCWQVIVPPDTLPPRTRWQIIERELDSLTLSEWRQDAVLCTQSQNVLSSPIVRQMLAVVHNSHPAFQVMNGDMQARALQQARCEGYTMALADFESMAVHAAPQQIVPAEFNVEEVSDEEALPYSSKGKKVA